MNVANVVGDIVNVEVGENKVMVVDLHTWESMRMARFRWRLHTNKRYAYTCCGGLVLAHRFIMKAPSAKQVDHINGDGLDNRMCNLRFATQSQNMMNRRPFAKHGFKGIYFHKGKWVAMLKCSGKRYYLGRFKEAERAAKAYDRAALAVSGEFALLNFENLRASYRPKMPTECGRRKAIL